MPTVVEYGVGALHETSAARGRRRSGDLTENALR
jgi:hypothetical protein